MWICCFISPWFKTILWLLIFLKLKTKLPIQILYTNLALLISSKFSISLSLFLWTPATLPSLSAPPFLHPFHFRAFAVSTPGWTNCSSQAKSSLLFVFISEVAQSCLTLCDPMDCSLSGSPLHGIFQARGLEWIAISFSRGSSQPRNRMQVSCIAGTHFTIWANKALLEKSHAYLFISEIRRA